MSASLLLTKCCCAGSSCFQRWTVDWDCDSSTFDDPQPQEKKCFPNSAAPASEWVNIDTEAAGCTYEIWVPMGSACTDDTDCTILPDTDPPDPGDIPTDGDGVPLDCCCPCVCCRVATAPNLNIAIDATGMTPTVPGVSGWVNDTSTPFNAAHAQPWIPHPAGILNGGGAMNDSLGGVYTVAGGCYAGHTFAVEITLTCNGPKWEVEVTADSCDDLIEGGGAFAAAWEFNNVSNTAGRGYEFTGLTCVNGRPVGTVSVPMTYTSTGLPIDPMTGDCGNLVLVFF